MSFPASDPSSETSFEGTVCEFSVTLITVKPGDVIGPRYGIPDREYLRDAAFELDPKFPENDVGDFGAHPIP